MEEDGSFIEHRARMIKKCEEFYTKLYITRRPQDQRFTDAHYMETCPLPLILPSEVRDAIKRLKRSWGGQYYHWHSTGWGRAYCQDVHQAVQQMHCGLQSLQLLEEQIGNRHPPQEGRNG